MTERALSIRQPWAWAIVYGGKPVENRTWRTSYRGRLLIHASKTFDVAGYEYLAEQVATGDLVLPRPLPSPSAFLYGGIIGAARLVTCIEDPNEVGDHAEVEYAEDVEQWWTGPYGFLLAEPEPLRFQPCRGMPGLFRPEVQP